eukprot:2561005-Amphidinium_carterae.1
MHFWNETRMHPLRFVCNDLAQAVHGGGLLPVRSWHSATQDDAENHCSLLAAQQINAMLCAAA